MAVEFEGKDHMKRLFNPVDFLVVCFAGLNVVAWVRDRVTSLDVALFGTLLMILLIRNLMQRWAFQRRMTPTEQELFRETRSPLSWRPPKDTETPA